MRLFNKIAIVGVGLIGGSLGRAIKQKKIAGRVIGIGRYAKSIARALKLGAIDEGSLDLTAVKSADLIILCADPEAIISSLPKVAGIIPKEILVIDAGSTKGKIMEAAKKAKVNFIGCHPLAGLEKKGVGNAFPGLFNNSLCFLTPLSFVQKKDLEKIRKFWSLLGSRTLITGARRHDSILSYTSHLPHAVAFSLISCLKKEYLCYGVGGLKDITRIALSDPYLWRSVFLTNREELLKAIGSFKKSLGILEKLIKNNRASELEYFLQKAQNKRRMLK